MSTGWRSLLVLGVLLLAGTVLVNATSWLYAEQFVCTGEGGDTWHWVAADGQQARFQFALPQRLDLVVLDVTVCIPTPRVDDQEVIVRVRGLTGRWTSFRVPVRLAQNSAAHPVYNGQLVISRRALGLGSTLHVALEQGLWSQSLGTHEGSVRLLTASPSIDREPTRLPQVIQVIEHTNADTRLTWEGELRAAGEMGSSVGFSHNGVLEIPDHRLDESDWDWFRINLTVGQVLHVRVELARGACTVDILAPDGRMAARLHGGTVLEITYVADKEGAWYVGLLPGRPQPTPYDILIQTGSRQ